MSHANISFFIPHVGCPHMCSFCNQVRITGHDDLPSGADVERVVTEQINRPNYSPECTEIAFFGGSFTAVDLSYQKELLKAAYKFIKDGFVSGIRISTRPDAINNAILSMLKSYGVTSIELGAQSMDDDVLLYNNRGHSKDDVIKSSKLIKSCGFSLGLQMMTGLYMSTAEKDIQTAIELSRLKPDTMRIYPTIVMKDTELERLFVAGKYNPPSLDDTVELCTELLDIFEKNNIKVIRLGLHDSDDVKACVAGPYHPAFAELCKGRAFLKRVTKALEEQDSKKVKIIVSQKELSQAAGHKKCNKKALTELGYNCIFVGDENIEKGTFRIVPIQ